MIHTACFSNIARIIQLTSICAVKHFLSTNSYAMTSSERGEIVINLAGDVMIGRLIDQLLPTSVHNPEEASIVHQLRSFRSTQYSYLKEGNYTYATIWGDTIPLWREGNLNIANLETAITNYDRLWPRKVFNYRTHPANVACLTAADIHHVSLANNHTLDFNVEGLNETCDTLDRSGISYVGAGKTREHALGPVFLDVPVTFSSTVNKLKPNIVDKDAPRSSTSLRIALLSASDHPSDWTSVPSFNLIHQYDHRKISAQFEPLIATARSHADFVIFSVHWGPNYQWIPDKKIQEVARWMIHQGVDLIHGHSSHHIQGIELVQRQDGTQGLILYGCGDFLDDYAIEKQYRNDLGALFQLRLFISSASPSNKNLKKIHLHSLSVFPTRCSNFQVNRLDSGDVDWKWVKDKLSQLSNVDRRLWTTGNSNELKFEINN